MTKLISFDIDGTLEVGQPPGRITMEMVKEARRRGFFIGSCSDRTISDQERMWQEHGIPVHFLVLKHQLGDVRTRFQADEYYHVGDTDMDRRVAEAAGFLFLGSDTEVLHLWDANEPD